jgi:hypothetical protein
MEFFAAGSANTAIIMFFDLVLIDKPISRWKRFITRNAINIPPLFIISIDAGMRCVLWSRLNEIDEGRPAALRKGRDGEIQRIPCNLQRAIFGRRSFEGSVIYQTLRICRRRERAVAVVDVKIHISRHTGYADRITLAWNQSGYHIKTRAIETNLSDIG